MIERLVTAAGLCGGGLRIALTPQPPGLAVTLASGPGPEEKVVRAGAVLLFLDTVAQQRLNRQVLDVRADAFGATFFLRDSGDGDDRADRAERDRQTAEALRAYLAAKPPQAAPAAEATEVV